MTIRIAIIGAGLSGLTLANELSQNAIVTVFEKARGVGGRMSTRYADPFYFDHGARCFTARTKAFQHFIEPYKKSGVIAEWQGKVLHYELGKKPTKSLWFEPHLVAVPNMNSLCKSLAEAVDVKLNTEIAPLSDKQPDGWHLTDKNGVDAGIYDMVLSTAPPAQTIKLFGNTPLDLMPLDQVRMVGCYSLMVGFNQPWKHAWIAAKVLSNPLGWVAINSTKPGRNNEVTSIVAYSTNEWAEQHIDDDMEKAQNFLCQQLKEVTDIDIAGADYLSTHRWRYATVENSNKVGPYFDSHLQLGCTGDWNSDSRVEDVWLAAMQLARKIPIS